MPLICFDIEQGSDEWKSAKTGKPSASNAHRLITSTGSQSKSLVAYGQELAGEVYAGKSLNDWTGNAATQFGSDTEAEARLAYEMQAGHEAKQVGFIEDDMQQFIVSPDGLISSEKDGEGLVEIKCKPKLHIATLVYYKRHGRIPTDYVAQLQMQLLISQREWVDIYYYSKDLPCLCVRVFPDKAFMSALEAQLSAVIVERNLILETLRSFE